MERAKHTEYYASILAVVLLFSPQLAFARGMSGGAAGRAGGFSSSSTGSRSAGMVFSGPRGLVQNPGSRAVMATRRIQPSITAGGRGGGTASFFPLLPHTDPL